MNENVVISGYLNEAKIDLVDFFIESTYTDTKGGGNACRRTEYGAWYHDEAKYCSKEVDTFRYFDEGIDKLKSLLS